MTERAYASLIEETRRLIAGSPDLAALAEGLSFDLPLRVPMPRQLPVVSMLEGLDGNEATGALTGGIRDAAASLHWQHSYRASRHISQDFLDRSGWFNLISPEGPFVSPEMRVAIGYWGAGLVYPWHRHQPEEVYCVLAGSALFEAEGRAPRLCLPGASVHHPPNLPHAARMEPGPLLALALWRGEGLLAPSTFLPELERQG